MDNLIDYETEQTVIDYIPRNATLHSLAEFFSACSDATRAKIICALCISEMCVSDLSRILDINQTTCSHQLRLLRAADIVKQRRDGKVIYYSLKNKKIENVLLAGVDFLVLITAVFYQKCGTIIPLKIAKHAFYPNEMLC